MAEKKIPTKRLTSSGAGACILTFFAALFSIAAACEELIAVLVYNGFYTGKIKYMFAKDFDSFLTLYHSAIEIAVLALIMFIWACSGVGARRIGREYPVIAFFMPLVILCKPVFDLVDLAMSSRCAEAFKTPYDGDKFRMVAELAVNGLPVLSGLLIIFAGLRMIARFGKDDFAAEVVKRKTKKNQGGEFDTPKGFNNKKLSETEEFSRETVTENTADQADLDEVLYSAPVEKPADPVQLTPVITEDEQRPKKKPRVILCPNCGDVVESGEMFCSNCGKKI